MLTLLHGLMWAPALVAGCISEPKLSEQTKATNPVRPDQDFSLTTTCGFLIPHSIVTRCDNVHVPHLPRLTCTPADRDGD